MQHASHVNKGRAIRNPPKKRAQHAPQCPPIPRSSPTMVRVHADVPSTRYNLKGGASHRLGAVQGHHSDPKIPTPTPHIQPTPSCNVLAREHRRLCAAHFPMNGQNTYKCTGVGEAAHMAQRARDRPSSQPTTSHPTARQRQNTSATPTAHCCLHRAPSGKPRPHTIPNTYIYF
jgi:hypothetical protein